jgi:hypothetical protein
MHNVARGSDLLDRAVLAANGTLIGLSVGLHMVWVTLGLGALLVLNIVFKFPPRIPS